MSTPEPSVPIADAVPEEEWIPKLAELLADDRQDSWVGDRVERGLRVARRYARWLERLRAGPGEAEARWEREIRTWPGTVFFHAGKPTILVAPQGHGKTNAACYLMDKILRLRPEWDLYTNIPFPWNGELEDVVPRPPNLHSVRSATQLMAGIARTILAGRTPAAVLDETGQWLSSHDWRSDPAENMTKFVYVERHFRLRGPLLVYHTWRSVLEPFRTAGDLRGSYCRVVKARGMYRFARVEDQSMWWRIGETALPYLTLGLTGFDMDLNFRELGEQLHGPLRNVAQQTLDYLERLEEQRAAEAAELAAEARTAHVNAIAAVDLAVTEQHRARLERREEIIRAFMEDPDLPNRVAQERFRASSKYLVELRRIALARIAGAGSPSFPVSQGGA